MRLVSQMQVLSFIGRGASNEIVEDVEVAFARWRARHATSLKIIIQRLDTAQSPSVGVLKFCVLSEARRIRVEQRSCIPKGLEDEFGTWDLGGELCPLFAGITNAQLDERPDSQPPIL